MISENFSRILRENLSLNEIQQEKHVLYMKTRVYLR